MKPLDIAAIDRDLKGGPVVRCLYPDVVAVIEAGEDTREVAS